MGRCSVISCRMKNRNTHQNITLHRLPVLRDDAWPSSELLLPAQFENCKEQESVSRKVLVEKPSYSTSNYAELSSAQFNKCEEQKSVSHIVREETPAFLAIYQPHVTGVRSNKLFLTKYLERNLFATLTLLRINSLK
ncbi:unnamed protein product [Parnassius apollo]|uniref:(apollo) hypothetical protein n=1 Tax=Parnassius apollo TaxID=110799 RepID=A0A8S3WAK4_PARAO|nr:unnamed protein product [Parnassius apollo]